MSSNRLEWTMATFTCVLTTVLVMMCLVGPVESAALAGDSVTPNSNGIGVMTLSTGAGPDNRPTECVYLLDNRAERLMIYAVEMNGTNRTLALRSIESLPDLFRAGRPR